MVISVLAMRIWLIMELCHNRKEKLAGVSMTAAVILARLQGRRPTSQDLKHTVILLVTTGTTGWRHTVVVDADNATTGW
ncbi:hypothetical protein E2562_033015 [Oryza meyeriana var. granulata]|uniref:Uncharacterized protein n=1 Tax=Oryza meyeriana var. granulata TaxID=110450 RepID=A0A6G1CVQ4_9ORYZ|nr:hypothetical protein E2562_033015 [Oryza meyeriana var. granulata]